MTAAGNDPLVTDGFNASAVRAAVARAPGVSAVRTFQASLLDVGSRRLWVRARPVGDRELLQSSQLLHGELARATAQIRAGAWAAVSSGFASEHHLGVGSPFSLPTPAGAMPLRVAAITTNSGWPPGAITINQSEYEHFWQTSEPTALEVELNSGVSEGAGRRAVASALAAWPALQVQTRAARETANEHAVRESVQSLDEISRLVLIAAALAITFALSAAIAARRVDLSARKAEGYQPLQLWRVLLLESVVVVGVGALDGLILGVYGHSLASRWLRLSQGFPAHFSLDVPQLLLTLGVIAGVTLAVVLVAGALVVRVPPRLAERE